MCCDAYGSLQERHTASDDHNRYHFSCDHLIGCAAVLVIYIYGCYGRSAFHQLCPGGYRHRHDFHCTLAGTRGNLSALPDILQ